MGFTVKVTSGRLPSVDLNFDQDTPPTQDEIVEALEEMHEQMDMEGYLAEFIITEGGNWTSELL